MSKKTFYEKLCALILCYGDGKKNSTALNEFPGKLQITTPPPTTPPVENPNIELYLTLKSGEQLVYSEKEDPESAKEWYEDIISFMCYQARPEGPYTKSPCIILAFKQDSRQKHCLTAIPYKEISYIELRSNVDFEPREKR